MAMVRVEENITQFVCTAPTLLVNHGLVATFSGKPVVSWLICYHTNDNSKCTQALVQEWGSYMSYSLGL